MNSNESSWGLAGIGRCAGFTAELDEPFDGKGPWRLGLNGLAWSFRLSVSGREDARTLSTFVDRHEGKAIFATHRIGSFSGAETVLVKDSEFEDRFFLRTLGAGQMIEVTIHSNEAVLFRKALQDLVADLDA